MTSERILVGKGSEAPVERAFKAWLVDEGWTLVNEAGSWADVIANRGRERLIGEVKGYTGSNTGLDVDTMFGQLLRRMEPDAATTWAVIVPTLSLTKVLRVPIDVRRALGIKVFEVREDDSVVEHLV
jgi:Holliday junction resolvase